MSTGRVDPEKEDREDAELAPLPLREPDSFSGRPLVCLDIDGTKSPFIPDSKAIEEGRLVRLDPVAVAVEEQYFSPAMGRELVAIRGNPIFVILSTKGGTIGDTRIIVEEIVRITNLSGAFALDIYQGAKVNEQGRPTIHGGKLEQVKDSRGRMVDPWPHMLDKKLERLWEAIQEKGKPKWIIYADDVIGEPLNPDSTFNPDRCSEAYEFAYQLHTRMGIPMILKSPHGKRGLTPNDLKEMHSWANLCESSQDMPDPHYSVLWGRIPPGSIIEEMVNNGLDLVMASNLLDEIYGMNGVYKSSRAENLKRVLIPEIFPNEHALAEAVIDFPSPLGPIQVTIPELPLDLSL